MGATFELYHINSENIYTKTIYKELWYLTSNHLLISYLRKVRRRLKKEEKAIEENAKLNEAIKNLPKSLLRDMNIDAILDD